MVYSQRDALWSISRVSSSCHVYASEASVSSDGKSARFSMQKTAQENTHLLRKLVGALYELFLVPDPSVALCSFSTLNHSWLVPACFSFCCGFSGSQGNKAAPFKDPKSSHDQKSHGKQHSCIFKKKGRSIIPSSVSLFKTWMIRSLHLCKLKHIEKCLTQKILNERAQDSVNFIDREEENSRLAGKKKPLQVAQGRQALCACGEPKRKFFLNLKYKCSYRRLGAVEDPAIPLFPKFPADEERKGEESFL
jgi:hypothetical protein